MTSDPKSDEEAVGGVPARLLAGHDGGTPQPTEIIEQLPASAPPEVKARSAEFARESQSASEDSVCVCLKPDEGVEWSDRADIGMTSDYWEVTRMRCAKCHTPWIRAFIEYEAFPRSGRYYRAPTTDPALFGVTPEAALHIIETASLRIAGGSRFDGVERVISGPGKLMASP